MDGRLRTFCHISEYDEEGYRQLHRLIASSDPLVLWAPSSQFLLDPKVSGVLAEDFLYFVEEGMVQVVAREEWLTSESSRNNHPWEGARWNKYIDSTLREMFIADEGIPDPRQRRVAGAAEETGNEEARRIVEERPEVAAEIVEALKDRGREAEIPPGTLATAARSADDAHGRAQVVLRDAYNHADAMALSGAETPILLSPKGVFSNRVAAFYAEEKARKPEAGGVLDESSATATAAELSRQLVELLARLEELGPPADLRSFMAGSGHRNLVEWSRSVIRRLVKARPANLKDQLVDALRDDLESGSFHSGHLDERFAEVASRVGTIKGLLEGSDLLVLLGLAFDAYPLLKEVARKRDLIDDDFAGPQWPFRYLWGSGARHGRYDRLLDLMATDAC